MTPTHGHVSALPPVWNSRFGHFIKINVGAPNEGNCSWDCFYCPKRTDRQHDRGWSSKAHIMAELLPILENAPSLESIMVVGNADPSMNPEFNEILKAIRDERTRRGANWQLGCMVNGSSAMRPQVRDALNDLDLPFVKLDCADSALFERINRPCTEAGNLNDHLSGVKNLKSFHIQTTLWKCAERPEFQNWTHENLEGLYKLFSELKPLSVYLTTLGQKKGNFELVPVTDSDLGTFALRIEELGIPVKVNRSFPGGDMAG